MKWLTEHLLNQNGFLRIEGAKLQAVIPADALIEHRQHQTDTALIGVLPAIRLAVLSIIYRVAINENGLETPFFSDTVVA
ncbi:hypothetical protein, partial [Vibrio parahaemolyticus]|uniref:hypothetical protein n=1 Tax=Vibrio parahaemolyticus TaxID=670 RepID=UPI00146E267C